MECIIYKDSPERFSFTYHFCQDNTYRQIDKGSGGTYSQQSGYAMINTYIYLHCLNKLPTLYYRAVQFKSEVAMRKDRWLLSISKWFSFHKHRIYINFQSFKGHLMPLSYVEWQRILTVYIFRKFFFIFISVLWFAS